MDGVGTGTGGETVEIFRNGELMAGELTLSSDIHSSADRPIEGGSAGVLSSLRCCYSTECEDTGHLLPTSGGVSWGRSYSRPFPLEIWSTSYSSRQSDRAGESDRVSSHDGGGGRGGEGDGGGPYIFTVKIVYT